MVAALVLAAPVSARAEIVYFHTGRTYTVNSHRFDGDRVVLTLRSGGEITCPRDVIARIAPDEVPYVDPAEAAVAALPAVEQIDWTAVPFADLIKTVSAEHGVSPELVSAVVRVESAYRPRARSPKGAKGLMQLMPATLRQYQVKDPYDPRSNLDAGIQHLKSLLDRFDLSLALAAYNAGEAAVQRFGGIPPYRETRNYVQRILALVQR
jgi:soluble lytic murein transglycosylase-like protein